MCEQGLCDLNDIHVSLELHVLYYIFYVFSLIREKRCAISEWDNVLWCTDIKLRITNIEAMFFRFKNPLFPFCLFANSASYTKLPNSPDFTGL